METLDRLDAGAAGAAAATRSLTLPFERRARSRQRVLLDEGGEVLLMLPRGTVLRDGDVLGSTAGDQIRPVVVRAADETVSVAASADPGLLLRAAYHLGNRHVALQIGAGWLRYLADPVLDELCRGLGLAVAAASLPFEPEAGAYAGGGQGHSHGHR